MSPHRLTRLYARLLSLYPAEHRTAWGAGMEATFARRAREIASRGAGARLRFVVKEFGNLLATALEERSSVAKPPSPRSPRRNLMNSLLTDLRGAVGGGGRGRSGERRGGEEW